MDVVTWFPPSGTEEGRQYAPQTTTMLLAVTPAFRVIKTKLE